ncbi:pheromone processing endoprotease [Rachicladosporium monterosium]|uniref:Pheromone processing endoprotease n=1 Tax=Rachicladosporium monterosium TaxID=1507873 RepID=A0ABR0LEC6_9PEZI|nr:pheromone processing endoprotease [Rachicladosporium monterosium]
MRVSRWLPTAVLAFIYALPATWARNYSTHDYYAVHISPGASPEQLAEHLNLRYEGPLGQLDNHYLLRADRAEDDHVQTAIEDLRRRRRKREAGAELPHLLDHVLLSQKQDLRKRFPLHKRGVVPPRQDPPIDAMVQKGKEIAASLGINDPIFQDQWHLYNHVQPGHDINVTGVWAQGITGKNSTVCIVDDGLDMDSDDLRENYFAAGSYDFNDHVADPKPRLSDDHHGTRCAGEIAAARNDVCGVGVAYDGKVSGARILSGAISDVDEAIAMNYAFQENLIYSCSWGPPDDGQSMEEPGILIRRAMVTGIQQGRGGLGSVYVFAIGNGAANDDNCNFDGYTNSIYSVSVGGIDRKGLHPYYSEKCSAQLVVTYSSGSGDAIHTTDVGRDKCYTNHGGTSAAGPLVAGIYALAMEHVTVTMNIQHTRRGDLSVELRSPSGMVSHIATHRRNDAASAGYVDWTFMSVAHWGESGVGSWTVVVKDTNVNEHNGTFTDWKLKLWGESIDAARQGLLPMPTEHDDDDHDDMHIPTVGTTSVAVPTETGMPEGNPDDHQHRPVNSKLPVVSATATPTATATPPSTGNGDDKDKPEGTDPATPTATSSSTPSPDHLLPHIFPTFGVTKKTQLWIYGSATLILIFLCALGGYFLHVRRKRRRWMTAGRGDDYGFEMVGGEEDDDHDGGGGGMVTGNGNGRAKKATAGRLYDAFAPAGAEDSDREEEDAFGLGSEEEDEGEEGQGGDGRGRGGVGGDRYRDA